MTVGSSAPRFELPAAQAKQVSRFVNGFAVSFLVFFQNDVSCIDARCIARGTGSAPDQGTDQGAFEVHKSDFDYLLGD